MLHHAYVQLLGLEVDNEIDIYHTQVMLIQVYTDIVRNSLLAALFGVLLHCSSAMLLTCSALGLGIFMRR